MAYEFEIVEPELIIYTDGASIGGPRRGGIGYRYILPNYKLQSESYIDEWEGQFIQATNNQMELLACIKALENCDKITGIEKVKSISVFTDSKYVQKHISFAKFYWPKNQWLTSTGEPVENDDLWKRLTKAINNLYQDYRIRVEFEWVKAHLKGKKKDFHNDVVDGLAKKGRDSAIKIPFRYVDVRKKITSIKTKKGSVVISGQQMIIRILGCEKKKTAKVYKMRYELISNESEYLGKVDIIYYSERLMEGHYYEIITSKNGQVPIIKEIVREVDEALKRNQINKNGH